MHFLLKDGIQQVPNGTPLCKDCLHFKQLKFSTVCMSDSYNTIIDPVFGNGCSFQKTCLICRSDGNINGCGPLGLKYQHKGQ